MNFISVAIMLLLFCEYLIALGTLVLCLFMNFIDMVHLFLLFFCWFFYLPRCTPVLCLFMNFIDVAIMFPLFWNFYSCTLSLYELH